MTSDCLTTSSDIINYLKAKEHFVNVEAPALHLFKLQGPLKEPYDEGHRERKNVGECLFYI